MGGSVGCPFGGCLAAGQLTPYQRKWTTRSVGRSVNQFTCASDGSCHGASHAASRAFPIFAAAAPLTPAGSMLPGSLFANAGIKNRRTERTQGKLNSPATAGMGPAGCSKLRGPRGSVSTRGLRDGGRRIPDGGSQSPRLDRRVPCRARCFRGLQSIPPITLASGWTG
jgi:hypothetical protein